MRQGKKVSARRKGLTVAFVLLFIFSSGMLIHDFVRSAREQAANEALVQRVKQGVSLGEGTSETSSGNSTSAQTSEQERNYQPLIQENSHLAAWLMMEDTEVDYPVLYTPEEPEYYLRRAFDGSYALSGSLFIGANSFPDGSNIIIYGHNMKDDSMFGSLDSYADEDYAREHQKIIYDLIQPDGSYERLTFEVMAAFYSRIYSVDEENVFRYYYGTDLSDPDAFQYYIEEVMSASLYDLGVTAEYGDRLLTLSTCSYHTEDGRFVVVAREKRSSTSTR
jgi:sortase B|nr:class B sortase [uncultured Oscillibacter sp.]